MQENGIFSSGSPPTAECVRTLMSARRTLPAKYNFSNFLQFFLFLDSPDWVIISIFEWDIIDCKLSGLWALPQYKRRSQVRRCLLSSGYYCQNQKEISVRPITRNENNLWSEKMLRHNIFGQGYAREAGPASRCKRISRRCRSTDFACLRKPVSDFDLMVTMTQPVVEVVIFVIDMYSFAL